MMSDPAEPSPSASSRANSFPWPPVLLAAALAGAWLMGRIIPLGWPGLDDTPARLIGFVFGIGGAALIAWSVATLIRHKTTVMPDQISTVLVTSGPYSFFRNPIYLGETLVMLGIADVTKNIWFALAAMAFAVLVTLLQIGPEERHLEHRFGEAYREYKLRARRWI